MVDHAADESQWWKSAVVYQIYPRSYADSNGDGIGDLPGITAHVDYLSELGIDLVWLSPVYVSPQDGNGYDISDYCAIDPSFGTLADLDEVIDALHERGIKLMMDLVVNHTSDEHPWFVESRDPSSPKRAWYWWAPPREAKQAGEPGAEPTNWASAFSGPAWQLDEASGEYYLHLFSRKQPDLNWENTDVRAAVYAMMRWWVDRGVDGFRMDVINVISKRLPFSDGPVVAGAPFASAFLQVANGPRMHEFLVEMHREVLAGHDLISVGEMPGVDTEQAKVTTDPASAELDMVFTFEHMNLDQQPGGSKYDLKPLALTDLKANLTSWQVALAEIGWNSLYWNNHDQPRVVSRFGDDTPQYRSAAAKSLGSVLHLLKGTPYVFQGEEIGMTNFPFTAIDQFQDIEAVNYLAEATRLGRDPAQLLQAMAVKSRDNARTPMQWTGGSQAGFTTGTPWIAVNPNHAQINTEAAIADPDSVFHHYRKLIALRHDHEVVVHGRYQLLLPEHEQLFAYTRTLDDQVLTVLANLSSDPADLPASALVGLESAELLLATHADREPARLAPWESRVLLAFAG
ncbi:MAG: alpha-glucosidase [Propionibacteriaceae bacterium]